MRYIRGVAFSLLVGASTVEPTAQSSSKPPAYFPAKVFADLKHSRYLDGKLQDMWFGSQLSGLQEPPLIHRSDSDEPVYRFTFLPSFGHPVVVRVTLHSDGTGTVVTRVGKGAGGYAPKGLLSDHSAEINSPKVQALKNAVAVAKFWSLPTEPNQQGGTDGSEWLFEAADAGRYHVVDRWEGADLRPLGLFFLNDVSQVGPEAELANSLK
jgi:hypothetical protein